MKEKAMKMRELRTFPEAWREMRWANRYLMNDYFRPYPTVLFVSMEEAAALLAAHYKHTSRMKRKQLESKLNKIAGKSMDRSKVALFCYFCVVGPNGEYDEPPFAPRPQDDPELSHEGMAFGSKYDYNATYAEMLSAWHHVY